MLSNAQKEFGPNDKLVAAQLVMLGNLYQKESRHDDAERSFKQAVSIFEKILGPNDLLVAGSLNNLGNLYRERGRYADAEKLHKRALGIRERALGATHPYVGNSLNNLASVYEAQVTTRRPSLCTSGRWRSERKRLVISPRCREYAEQFSRALRRTQARYAEAEPLYKRSLAIHENVLGPNHPEVAMSLNNLALLYTHQGRYADAEPLYKRSLSINEELLGADHPNVGMVLNNLAWLCIYQRRYARRTPCQAVVGDQRKCAWSQSSRGCNVAEQLGLPLL